MFSRTIVFIAVALFSSNLRAEAESEESWLRLCVGLYNAGDKLESVHCSKSIKDPVLKARYRQATFGELLFTHGDPLPPGTLLAVRGADGSRIITNDPAVLKRRGLPAASFVAPWRPISAPGVDAAPAER